MYGADIRQGLLTVINRRANLTLQLSSILDEAAVELKINGNREMEQTLLTVLHDLFRNGYLAWGHDIANAEPPFFHITKQGRIALQTLSRDPMNPDGYKAYLLTQVSLSAIPMSYITEALDTYNANCHKATAVMVGCAAESVTLELRETLVKRMTSLGHTPPAKLKNWKIGEVLSSIKNILDNKTSNMPQPLREKYNAFWTAFTEQIRINRNDAGHPISVDPVTQESVHASLLIFPDQARLASDLKDWINTSYT